MQNQGPNTTGVRDMNAARDEIADSLRSEAKSARETLHSAREEAKRKAGEYASEAKAAAFEQAEGAQKSLGETLAALGGALRAASDHLARDDHGTISKLVNDAAGGVESFSNSIRNRKFDEILRDVRTMGRENSGMLFAGSMLAGLALGRFVKSSAAHSKASAGSRTDVRRDSGSRSFQTDPWEELTPGDPLHAFGAGAGQTASTSNPADTGASPHNDFSSPEPSNIFGDGNEEKR